jgi:carboxymethylenebutenolidase
MTSSQRIDVKTDDGVAPCWVHAPSAAGKHPAVVMVPDAGSVRPAAHDVAQRLADHGYIVLLPDILYRAGDYAPFDFKTVFGDPGERARLMKIIGALDTAAAMRDMAHYIRAAREQPGAAGGRVGVAGYCLGGRLAFTAAAVHATDIAAAACFHAGHVVTEAPDSPHLASARIEAALYFGVADNDQSCTPEHQGALATALGQAHIDYAIELYKGAAHGFAMPDFPGYDAATGDRHLSRMVALFQRTLTAG